MLLNVVDSFVAYSQYFQVVGLVMDLFGAILVLGPELPFLAQTVTTFERYRLKMLLSAIERGKTVSRENYGFRDLQIAVYQGHMHGDSLEPVSVSDSAQGSFFYLFDEIEMVDNAVEIRMTETGASARFQFSDLENWVENYTGTEGEYFLAGAVLLVTGFFFQVVAELTSIHELAGFGLFILGAPLIIYYALKHRFPEPEAR